MYLFTLDRIKLYIIKLNTSRSYSQWGYPIIPILREFFKKKIESHIVLLNTKMGTNVVELPLCVRQCVREIFYFFHPFNYHSELAS